MPKLFRVTCKALSYDSSHFIRRGRVGAAVLSGKTAKEVREKVRKQYKRWGILRPDTEREIAGMRIHPITPARHLK